MIPRDKILAAYPILSYLAARGVEVKRSGTSTVAKCPFHDDSTPSMSISEAKGVWHCHACDIGGSIIDFEMRLTGQGIKDTMRSLAEAAHIVDDDDGKPHRVATYHYRDELGRSVMEVDRIQQAGKKRFSQSRIDGEGNRVNNITGVKRVLYRLEKWAGKAEVALAEGEKCVHALESLGFDATTNPGGSSNWLPAYSSYLTDKHVEVWPDRDDAGEKWFKAVVASLEGKVASLKICRLPEPYNDVADVVEAKGIDEAKAFLMALLDRTPRIPRGVDMPILSSAECYELYRKRIEAIETEGIDLGRWLPSLRHAARPLLPGDMGLILSDTGVGKTAILTNIACSQRPIVTLFFELELAPEPMCERFIARDRRSVTTLEVETQTRRGHFFDVSGWDHVYICPQTRITVDEMEVIINRAELKTQERPRLVLVDYVGLVQAAGSKRYEKISDIAESLKRLARSTETVVICASQVSRDKDRSEIGLHDARDSGALENSAQLVLGAWRPAVDRMSIKILKQTKRAGAVTIDCTFDGDRQFIGETFDASN